MFGIKRPFKKEELSFIFVQDKFRIPFIDKFIDVIHTPGHTEGSVCYLYDNKLYSGDTLFKESIGRTDFPGGNSKKMRDSIIKLFKLVNDETKVYPGHDEQTDIKHEKKYNAYYQKFTKLK
jgi:glyoxylase-like metal-dependent hydrolase (beta-lactamase superfamily II)